MNHNAPDQSRQLTALGELLRHIEQQSAAKWVGGSAIEPEIALDDATDSATELKAIRYYRDTWLQLSVEQQLTAAQAKAPENAGPLNSHALVLRALQRMRDSSPDYLSRFMSYADALLCLEQRDKGKLATKTGARRAAKTR